MRVSSILLLTAMTIFASIADASKADQTQLSILTSTSSIATPQIDTERFLRRRKHDEDYAAESEEERANPMEEVVAKLSGLLPTLKKVRKSTLDKGMLYLQQAKLSSKDREAVQAFLAFDEHGRQVIMNAIAGKR